MSLFNYITAETMFHELLHLDNVADSVGGVPNPVVDDSTITVQFHDSEGEIVSQEEDAYGPLRCKILARFKPILPDDFRTGHYVQRNCEYSGLLPPVKLSANLF